MAWKKLGKIYSPKGNLLWSKKYASVPTPLYLGKDIYRIFFSTRDCLNRNTLGYIEININNHKKIINKSIKPVFDLGKLGFFDSDGVYGTCLVSHKNELRLYYAGWNAGIRGTFYSSIGLAISYNQGKSFQRYSEAPILQRDEIDKWAVMAPYVFKIYNNQWLMWYASGIELDYKNINNYIIKSKYDIKLAKSKDGINWKKTGISSIKLKKHDTNIARVCVIKRDKYYEAWYPYVNSNIGNYRIGYARSNNGKIFQRLDNHEFAQLRNSSNSKDWDSKSVTYPYVFKHNENFYMLYNGNEFGKTGFGLAIWKS